MLFPTPIFLFLFLPLLFLGYFLIFKKFKNLFLLIASLIFYSWGEGFYVLVILLLVLINYIFGIFLGKLNKQRKKYLLILAVTTNLLFLAYFKYLIFLASILVKLLLLLGISINTPSSVYMPLGISFVTFHILSYLFDINSKKIKAERNIFNFALYIFLFPHLIAGPIVRFFSIGKQIKKRKITLDLFSEGVQRFILGLGKKVIIANVLAQFVDKSFAVFPHNLSAELVWLALIAYALQIYFDFSGYSDMAIGLAKMFGFKFAENFNYPYISTSIQEFWRRWHMTLSSWFRDYLYIPLGGSKTTLPRTILNIMIVFTLTGFWHGASFNFIFWGLYYGIFLSIERIFLEKFLEKLWFPIRHFYTLFIILIGWLFFRIDSLSYSFFLLKVMFGLERPNQSIPYSAFISNELVIIFVIAIFFSVPIVPKLIQVLQNVSLSLKIATSLSLKIVSIFILIYSIMQIASQTYNPFIYFRF